MAAGTTAALLLGVATWIAVNGWDIAPPDVSDLTPAVAEIPDDQNADTFFVKAFQSFQCSGEDERRVEDMLRGDRWDPAFAADLLARNAVTLALLKKGMLCPQYQSRDKPGLKDPQAYLDARRIAKLAAEQESRPRMQRHRMAKLLALKAVHELQTGSASTAREAASDLLQFGSLIQANPTSAVDCGLGMAAWKQGLQATGRLLQERLLSEDELVALLGQLNRTTSLDPGWVRAIQREYQSFSAAVDKAASDRKATRDIVNDYLFQPNRAKAEFAVFYRGMIGKLSQPYAKMDLPPAQANPSSRLGQFLSLHRPNGMVRLLGPGPDYLNGYLVGKCELKSHVDGLRLVVACRLYELRHGRAPETLDALTPELLREVPTDPFDGKPFRYVRADAVVFSVGRDLKDSWTSGQRSPAALLPRSGGTMDDLVYPIHRKAEGANR